MSNPAKSAITALGTRPYLRGRVASVVTAVSVTITLAAVAFNYRSSKINHNEEVQKKNGYVSVERSGGGV